LPSVFNGRDAIESYNSILGIYSRTVRSILNLGRTLISHPSSTCSHALDYRCSGAFPSQRALLEKSPSAYLFNNVPPHHPPHHHLSATLDRPHQKAPSSPPHPPPPPPTSPPRQVHPTICYPPLLDVQRLRQPPQPPHKSYQPHGRRAGSFHFTERGARG